ncbi:MAG: ABC transporter permease subunit [Kiritimatiellae bacterium]|jgi:ABC-2 type transport system permease protein|nr:ABC transporter permease subunit [Kiritimatiellia bacterium]
MSKTFLIFRREVGVYFYSTLAFSIFCVFLASTGFLFLQMVQAEMGTRVTLSTIMFKLLFYCWLPIIVTFLSMQFFSDERKSGQLELILTLPVTVSQLIAAKFAAALWFLLLIILTAVSYVCFVEITAGGNIAGIITNLMGGILFIFFFGMFVLSIGMFVSTCTPNQLVCATLTFVFIFAFYFLGYVIDLIPKIPTWVKEFLNIPIFMNNFCDGVIDSRPLVFCFTGTILFLFYSIRVLEVSKHR